MMHVLSTKKFNFIKQKSTKYHPHSGLHFATAKIFLPVMYKNAGKNWQYSYIVCFIIVFMKYSISILKIIVAF